jgi:hypothetical protein
MASYSAVRPGLRETQKAVRRTPQTIKPRTWLKSLKPEAASDAFAFNKNARAGPRSTTPQLWI